MENENKSSRSGATLKKINPEDLVVGREYYVEVYCVNKSEKALISDCKGNLYYPSEGEPIYTLSEAPQATLEVREDNIELEMLVNVATALYVAHGTNADAVKTFMPDREQIAREALELITACKRAIKEGER